MGLGEAGSAQLAFECCDLGSVAFAVGLTWLGVGRMGGVGIETGIPGACDGKENSGARQGAGCLAGGEQVPPGGVW